jgi:RimJ/RimL family protein N-acetyltransferase
VGTELRLLGSNDAASLFSFLERHLDSSIILLSNAERDLDYRGEPFQATYVARFEGDAITAVAAHYANGNIGLQGDDGIESCVVEAVRQSGRKVGGLLGPHELTVRARSALGLERAPARCDGLELLFALDLTRLKVPALLTTQGVSCRPPTSAEVTERLAAWGAEYSVETLGAPRTPGLESSAAAVMERWRKDGRNWVLVHDGELVSYTGFNSRARGVVQVGGVFTPPMLRGRGYARAAVAGSLLDAQRAGARRSTLFTSPQNVAAIRAYEALGYERVGDFGLVLFDD